MMNEPIILWYKKTLKQSGKPIIVQQGRGKKLKEFQVDSFKLDNCRIGFPPGLFLCLLPIVRADASRRFF